MFKSIGRFFSSIFSGCRSKKRFNTVNPYNLTCEDMMKRINRYIEFARNPYTKRGAITPRVSWEYKGMTYSPVAITMHGKIHDYIVGSGPEPTDGSTIKLDGTALIGNEWKRNVYLIDSLALLDLCKHYGLYGNESHRKDMNGQVLHVLYNDMVSEWERDNKKRIKQGKSPLPLSSAIDGDYKTCKERHDKRCREDEAQKCRW